MSIKIDVSRDPKTRIVSYHLQAHAIVEVVDEVLDVDRLLVERAIADRLRSEILALMESPGARFDRQVF